MNVPSGIATRSQPLPNGGGSQQGAADLARIGFALGSIVLATIMFFFVVGTLEDELISAVVVLTIMLTVAPFASQIIKGRKHG